MRSRDWSLVFFTTLSQWSVGIIVWLTCLTLYSDNAALFVESGLSPGNPVLLALLLIAVATTSSFLHLGNPSNAPMALNNLAGSWLSREILAIGIYSLSLVVIFVFGWKTGDTVIPGYLLAPGSIAGLFLLWAMARVYIVPTIPAWNSWYTALSFATTGLCLGLITVLLLNTSGSTGIDKQAGTFYVAALVATLVLEILSGLVHQRQLEKMDSGIDGPDFGHGVFYRLFLARMAVLLFSCLALLLLVFQADFFTASSHFTWLYPVLALVVIQEFAGRHLFYSSYFRIGV